MSGICGLLRLDGQAADAAPVAAMLDAMAYRGPDGLNHFCAGQMALGHALLQITADPQPLPCQIPETDLYLTLDGRLDNTAELTAALGLQNTPSQAQLIAAAYHHWGDTFPRHLDGDFALALWDAPRQRLLCARDHTGTRPFYYYRAANFLAFATELPPLLGLVEGELQPNQDMVTQFLAQCWVSNGDTFWQGFRRLPPAHTLTVEGGQLQLQRYWQPDFQRVLEYPHLQDYHNHYRELLANILMRQGRSDYPVAFEVSGGLDSSALFAVASELQLSGDLPAPDIAGYTLDFRGCGDADEVAYAESVGRNCERAVALVPPAHKPMDWYRQRGRSRGEFCNAPNGVMSIGLFERASAAGSRVLINGTGGDEWLGGGDAAYAEAFGAAQVKPFLAMLREHAGWDGWVDAAAQAGRSVAAGHLPPALKAWLSDLLAREKPDQAHLSAQTRQRAHLLLSELRKTPTDLRLRARWQLPLWQQLNDAYALLAHESMEVLAAQAGLEIRRPYWSRRMIDFSISLPRRVLSPPGDDRRLHRSALAGLVAPEVLGRYDKAEFSSSFQGLSAEIASVFARGELYISEDWVGPDPLRRMLNHESNAAAGSANWALWFLFSTAAALAHQNGTLGTGS